MTNQNAFFTTPEVSSSDKNKNTRNVSEESANDNCRLLKFLSKYSSVTSSENPFKPWKRKDCFSVVLSEICCQLQRYLPLVKTSKRTLDMLEKASPPWGKSKSVSIDSLVDYRSYIIL